jgi:RNA polymerase sigma factor (sigma-70 family)
MSKNCRLNSDKSGDLVRSFRKHEPRALADMYDLYWRLAYYLIARLVQDPKVAVDLVHESFLRAWDQSEQLTGNDDRALGSWLMAIAQNCAREYLEQLASSDLRYSAQPDLSPERAALIADAFHDLSQKEKEVRQLAYCEDLSIAEHLRQPAGSVTERLGSALSWPREDDCELPTNVAQC